MMIDWDKASLAAISAKFAYSDAKTGRVFFKAKGYKEYKFVDIDGAQVHLAADATRVLFAFRGTQPTQISDLLADLNVVPKRHGPGFVHSGFRGEARKLWNEVEAWAERNKGKQFLVCGHSLGAAMATYTAQELSWHGHKNIELYTFGSPRLGSADYVAAMDIPHWRFVNNNDGVTHVPPAAMGFKHHGTLMYINHYGSIRPLSQWQRFKDMMRGYWAAIKKLQLFDWMYDHSIDGYSSKIENAKSEHGK